MTHTKFPAPIDPYASSSVRARAGARSPSEAMRRAVAQVLDLGADNLYTRPCWLVATDQVYRLIQPGSGIDLEQYDVFFGFWSDHAMAGVENRETGDRLWLNFGFVPEDLPEPLIFVPARAPTDAVPARFRTPTWKGQAVRMSLPVRCEETFMASKSPQSPNVSNLGADLGPQRTPPAMLRGGPLFPDQFDRP